MKTHYITKGIITTILLFFILVNVALAQSPSPTTPLEAKVKKEIVNDRIVLSFTNVIGENQSDFETFEDKVNQAGFLGLIKVEIEPKSKKMTAVFRKETTEENFLSFFRAVGYNSFQFIK